MSCPVMMVQLAHNYDQCDNPKLKEAMNYLVDEKGICQLRPLLLDLKPIPKDDDPLEWLEKTAS